MSKHSRHRRTHSSIISGRHANKFGKGAAADHPTFMNQLHLIHKIESREISSAEELAQLFVKHPEAKTFINETAHHTTALFAAVRLKVNKGERGRKLGLIKELIRNHASIEAEDRHGLKLVEWAVARQYHDVAALLQQEQRKIKEKTARQSAKGKVQKSRQGLMRNTLPLLQLATLQIHKHPNMQPFASSKRLNPLKEKHLFAT